MLRNDEVWKFIVFLIKIIDIRPIHLSLKSSKSYVKIFGLLKQKHHFMVYYGTAIKDSGFRKCIYCLRFEARHKDLKK